MQNNLTNSTGRMENPYLTTPALLGLTQHSAGFSEALRMSRTFAHQAAESKDYSGAFGGGPLSLRSFDFQSLPSPLFLSSPFLHASMDPRLPFGGSAFHPVSSATAAAAFDRKFFVPPKLCDAKSEPAGEYAEVSSTASGRRVGEDEDRTSGSERSSPETGRLKKRSSSPVDPSACPVCGAGLRPGEVAEHCRAEVERLLQVGCVSRERRGRDALGWETYTRVRGNRQLRLRCKARKRRGDDAGDCCPPQRPDVDDERLHPPAKRVATVTGGGGSPRRPPAEEEEVDVLGDVDVNSSDWVRPRDPAAAGELRSGADGARGSPGYQDGVPDTTAEKNSSLSETVAPLTAELERLRTQLSTLERETSRCRCGVCGLTYRQPLVSTHCWHVHCTPCWHAALGADRRCPQCSVQVSADDLNAIHV